jgi:hypothetical protein
VERTDRIAVSHTSIIEGKSPIWARRHVCDSQGLRLSSATCDAK